MKAQKKDFVLYLQLPINGQVQNVSVDIDEIRLWLEQLNIEPGQEKVSFSFVFNQQVYTYALSVSSELETLKRAVRYAELTNNIIPTNLRSFLADITKKISEKEHVSKAIGREHEIEKVWFYLSQKTRNNVFLIGEKDVGKTSIALEIAKRIAVGNCPNEFNKKRVLMLVPSLLLKYADKFYYQHLVNQLINFLVDNKDDIILYVDDVVSMKTELQLIYILYSCLKKYSIPFITTTSTDNFEDYFYNDQSISKYINYIHVDEPELNELIPIVQPCIEQLSTQYDVTISDKMVKYAIFTSDLNTSISANPGKVINILERAFLYAKRKNKTKVDKQCILSCSDARFKDYARMPESEKRATAYHEVGHYILAIKSKHRNNVKISCVSTLPTDWWAGVTMSYYDIEEYSVSSKDYCLDYIAMLLAGRYAEQKFTGLYSMGASSDLEKANNIAKSMIMDWGFSTNDQNSNRHYSTTDYFLMSEAKKEAIDREIQFFINKGAEMAQQVLNENAQLLETIVEKLLAEEILTGEELEEICNNFEQNKK